MSLSRVAVDEDVVAVGIYLNLRDENQISSKNEFIMLTFDIKLLRPESWLNLKSQLARFGTWILAIVPSDAIDAADHIGGGAFAQALDYRHAAGDRGLELQREAGAFGAAGKLEAVVRDHRLVGGDEALARGERRAGEGEGGAVRAADQLDHDIGPGVAGELGGVVDPVEPGDVDAAIL